MKDIFEIEKIIYKFVIKNKEKKKVYIDVN